MNKIAPIQPDLKKATVSSALGDISILYSSQGIHRIILHPEKISDQAISQTFSIPLAKQIYAYLKGLNPNFSANLIFTPYTPFQKQVWELTRLIEYGKITTYGELARKQGNINLARAVGQALAANPFPIVVPCHRVVNHLGELHGFSAGIDWKIKLLQLEGWQLTQNPINHQWKIKNFPP